MFLEHQTKVVWSIDGIYWFDLNQAYCDITIVDKNQIEKICHKGYIFLVLFLVNLMAPDYPRLESVLDLIRDLKELWSLYNVCNLSPKNRYYGKNESY